MLRGELRTLLQKLKRISALVRGRKNDGWEALKDDEVWEYFTEGDHDVCPVCEGFGTDFKFVGADIPTLFPDQTSVNYSDTMHRHRAPNVHESVSLYPDLRGVCRCNMFWRDPVLTLANRLHREIEMVQ